MPPDLSLIRWDRAASWAVSNASAELLQSIRDGWDASDQLHLCAMIWQLMLTVNGREPRGYVSVAGAGMGREEVS